MLHDPTVDSLHALLKRDTAREHAELEDSITQRRFFECLDGYVEYLRRFLAFQFEAEQLLDACAAELVIPDWPKRRRACLARADLTELTGAHADPLRDFAKPLGADHFARLTPGIESILGVAYVLEGSTLGGAVLLKATSKFEISPQRGGGFLASYGAERGRMWQRYLQTLELWDARGICRSDVVHAARETFLAARAHLLERHEGLRMLSSHVSEPRQPFL